MIKVHFWQINISQMAMFAAGISFCYSLLENDWRGWIIFGVTVIIGLFIPAFIDKDKKRELSK